MITLYINNKPAVIDEKQSIKYVRENTYFTKTGTYTYNISLPAKCPENIAIFGHLYRKDLNKQAGITFRAKLVVDNVEVLNGTALITNITETDIKIQLLGGNSELNFYTKNENLYIDELELGSWGISGMLNDKTMQSIAQEIQSNMNYGLYVSGQHINDVYLGICRRLWRENTKENPVDWVALPCVNENFEVICNNFGIKEYTDMQGNKKRMPAINDLENINLSAQPYLVPMIERIFAHLGYPVVENCLLDDEFFMHMVIVTANNRSAISRALPHWTVSQFIKEIENFLAVVVFINEKTKETFIKSRKDFFKENIENIDNVLDEYSVTVDRENTVDLSNANVGYAEVSEYDRIDEDIKKDAVIDTTFNNYPDLGSGLNALIDKLDRERGTDFESDTMLKYRGTIFKVCGRSYIIELFDYTDSQGRTYKNHARTITVDELANRISSEKKEGLDIELKIVPAKTITDASVNFYNSDGTVSYTKQCFHLVKADNTNPTDIDSENNIYIAGLISGETDKVDTKEDLMAVCLYDGGIYKRAVDENNYPSQMLTQIENYLFYPAGYIKDQWQADTYTGGGALQKLANESLSLHIDTFSRIIGSNTYRYKTLYSETIKNLQKIDTQIKYCIKFVTDKLIPVNSTFIIRGKKFVCEKLEYSINVKGIDKLVTGYFYELEE